MPGPLPHPNARRRNAPTIPTTELPASGRKGRAPAPPAGYVLGEAGQAWWAWAWKTPQAAAWSPGALYALARRAQLEDDLGVLAHVELGPANTDVLDEETGETLKWMIGRLKAMAAGELAIAKEARELDDRFGLTEKGLASLRWKIVDDTPAAKAPPSPPSRRREEALRIVRGEAG